MWSSVVGGSLLLLLCLLSKTLAQQPPTGQVMGLNLIQGGSNTVVANLFDGAIVNLPAGTVPNFGIDAIVTTSGGSPPITGVQFDFNNVINFKTEFSAPYALCGNVGPAILKCDGLVTGSHIVSAVTVGGGGGIAFTVRFQIVIGGAPTAPVQIPVPVPVKVPVPVPAPQQPTPLGSGITGFKLVHVPTKTDLIDLRNGVVVDPVALGVSVSFNIRAIVDGTSSVQSVLFLPSNRSESTQPFSYCGDSAGMYFDCPEFQAGKAYTITARPYTGKFLSGTVLPDVTVSFSIAGTSTPMSPPIKPPIAPVIPPVAPVKPPIAPVNPPVAPIKPPMAPVKPPMAPVNPPVAPVKPPMAPVKPPAVAPIPAPTPVAQPPTTFRPILINCGGVDYVDTEGRLWMADLYFDNGFTYSNVANDISNTFDDTIYHSERYGIFTYNIPMPIGEYAVILHFAEVYFTLPGERVFDVEVEGKMIPDIDIIQQSGGVPNKAITRETPAIVSDGFLTIKFLENIPIINNAKISGIEVKLLSPHFAHAVAGGPYGAVDANGNNVELVAVNAQQSHTHNAGKVLSSFTWKEGATVLGTGAVTNLNLSVGQHIVTLTVVDTGGDSNSDTTTVTVQATGFPSFSSMSPNTGDSAGGTIVTIKGSSLGSATAVRFGPTMLTGTAITVVSDTAIQVRSPYAGIDVPVEVSVITPVGESISRTFTYVGAVPVGFTIAKLMDFAKPSAIAFGPDGKLYVGNTLGQLGKFTLNDTYDAVVSSVIVTIGTTKRGIHGLCFDPLEHGDTPHPTVYISTSAILHPESRSSFGLAINGKIQTVRGANLDLVTDIVTNLPVSQLDHTVNGIYFGNKGELYIGVGSNTNGGIPGELSSSQTMKDNFFSSAILVANLGKPAFNGFITYNAEIDGDPVTGYGPNGVEVFAPGLRNPYGVVVHSNGQIYATDNGPNLKYGDMATGCGPGQQIPDVYEPDKLLRIVRGAYYGAPNLKRGATDPRQCVWRSQTTPSGNGYTAPLIKLRSSTDGIIEFASDHFNGQMRGNLILSKYTGKLYRVILTSDGLTVNKFSETALDLDGDGGLAVTQAPNGNLIDTRYESSACFFFRPNEPVTSVMSIKSVFPRRGGLGGGSKLSVFGVNFSGAPTVTVGGRPCTGVVLKSSLKIECKLPGGTIGGKDIVVQIGAVQDTFVNGYQYITGLPG